MENPYNIISTILEDINNQRTQDILRRRFGLQDGKPQTLQEIGRQYNITRERVRQIEENGLSALYRSGVQEKIKPIEEEIYGHIRTVGGLRREAKLFDDLVCVCFPKIQFEQLVKKDEAEIGRCQSALNLILTLGKPFTRINENDFFHPIWTIDKNSVNKAKKTIDSAVKFLNKRQQVLNNEELFGFIKKNFRGTSDEAINSYLDASKKVDQNHFGDFGLANWPEISPRGVRDRAYLVLKKQGKPLHFSEVTNLINQLLPHGKTAHLQTVHNELIKDQRFVLVGRGIYALKEWGYKPGTVVEVISQVLKEKGPLTKENILKQVLESRLIKQNTILINLQNKKFFKKLPDGRFSIA